MTRRLRNWWRQVPAGGLEALMRPRPGRTVPAHCRCGRFPGWFAWVGKWGRRRPPSRTWRRRCFGSTDGRTRPCRSSLSCWRMITPNTAATTSPTCSSPSHGWGLVQGESRKPEQATRTACRPQAPRQGPLFRSILADLPDDWELDARELTFLERACPAATRWPSSRSRSTAMGSPSTDPRASSASTRPWSRFASSVSLSSAFSARSS